MKNITFKSATEQLKQLHSGSIAASDLLEIYINRYQLHNPSLNAIVATDFEHAREQARLADQRIQQHLEQGTELPPLLGLPISIKDVFEVTGMVTAAGSSGLKNYRPNTDAAVVKHLRKAGAIIFAKTNTPFFASDFQSYNRLYGTSNNPWDLKRSPGGSSGGAAAAVAAGLSGFEVGSDLGGSIRNPASYCGIYGHKSSFGIVPDRGHIPPAPGTLGSTDLSVLGPLARNADDLELVLRIIAGPENPDATPWSIELKSKLPDGLSNYRIATLTKHPLTEVDQSVLNVIDSCFAELESAACNLSKERSPDIDLGLAHEVYFQLMAAVIGSGLPPSNIRSFKLMKPFMRLFQKLGLASSTGFAGMVIGSTGSHLQWARLNEQRLTIKRSFNDFFKHFDVLLTPVTATAAFVHNHKGTVYSRTQLVNGKQQPYSDHLVWAGLANLCGLPATVAPIGFTVDGLPVGIQIIGNYGNDLLTIDFARQLARLLPGYKVPDAYSEN